MQAKGQFAQFFEDVEETVTPTKGNSRFAPQTPNARLSISDLEKTTSAMTPRMEIMLRKEQKAREEAAQLTFKPHVNKNGNGNSHSATKSTSKDQSNRFDALYSDALKRHLETKWKESADEKDLTFQPKINPRGRASSRQGSRAGSRASSQEREAPPAATGERLHATPKGKLKHGVDPDNKLTFKPEITKRAMSIDRKESAKRLYVSNSLEKEQSKAFMRESKIKERELENCTFSPTLIQAPAKFAPKGKVDLNERMNKFEEMKRAKIQEAQRLREEKEIADATFKPVLKAKLKRAPTPTKPFHERLTQPIERPVPPELTKELAATMTFKPTLVSKRAASPNGRASDYNSVHERLFKEGEARKKETQMAMEALKHEAETSFTFSPEINRNSKIATGELGPVFERLATSTSKQYMQEVLMKVKTELELKECTFQPKLSTEGHRYVPKDKEVDSLPVHERLNQEAEAKRLEKERLETIRQEEAARQHSFAPQIPEASRSMISVRSFISPEAGGSVSGEDNIFTRLNSQTTLAKSPMVREASFAKESPQRTRSSIVLTEAEHSTLYDRLSSTPRSLSFIEKNRSSVDPNDDRASSVNRRSQAEIDNVINRLHSSQTKAMKAPAFEDPTSFHTILRSNSMSKDTTPNATPDKVSMRKSFSSDAPPMSFAAGASPLRRSASISMASPMSRSNSMMGMSPSAAAPSPMSRHSSIRMQNNTNSSAGAATSSSSAAEAEDSTPVKASPAPAIRGSFVQHPRPVSEELPPAPVTAAVVPPAAPAAAPKPKPVAAPAPAPTAAPAATTKPSAFKSNGDDFMAKIEASMNMLQMNPADIVAAQQQQQNKGSTAPSPVPEPVTAPLPVAVEATPVVAAVAPVATEETVEEADEEVEVVESVDNL